MVPEFISRQLRAERSAEQRRREAISRGEYIAPPPARADGRCRRCGSAGAWTTDGTLICLLCGEHAA